MPTYQKVIWAALGVAVIAILALAYFLFLAPSGREKAAAKIELTPGKNQRSNASISTDPAEDKDFSP